MKTESDIRPAELPLRVRWNGIAPGDMVTYSTHHGNLMSGRAMLCLPTHVVLNTGGRHGRPQVVDGNNYHSHKKRSRT